MSPVTLPREVEKIIADIVAAEMGLDEKHCLLGNQAWTIPADKNLFAVVFAQAFPPVGATSYLDTDPASSTYLKEVQEATVVHNVRVEVMSFDQSARTRAVEVVLALVSIRSQQEAEKYKVQIGRPQEPVDASETEVTKRLQKYVVRLNVTALHQKVQSPPGSGYYDKFNDGTTPGQVPAPSVQTQE